MTTVLVTGGTGLLGRRVCRTLSADGHSVRVLSRTASGPPIPGAETAIGDLSTGAGLLRAVEGTTAIVHCASDPRNPRAVDVAGTERLLEVAQGAGRPHVVYISIVGVDRIPMKYYAAKLAAEEAIARSGLPWTVLRATQFHPFVLQLLDRLTAFPVVPVPRGWRVQPVDVDEVARRLVDAVASGPAGRLPDLGGPEVFAVVDLVRDRLRESPRRRPVLELPVPGAAAAALRAGANLVPGNPGGGRTWQEFLDSRTAHRLRAR
ncbi:MAG TPA: NAD(P)H-binding protein [Nocardioides sp.]|nr:NAD(P)H-binding protein [Nocardioides sp.]